jgi:hypothetical protein
MIKELTPEQLGLVGALVNAKKQQLVRILKQVGVRSSLKHSQPHLITLVLVKATANLSAESLGEQKNQEELRRALCDAHLAKEEWWGLPRLAEPDKMT